jgi:UDP-N-acetylglucosamine diphosphorylase/glucosamine-1-phosphate N-acetyltransferase
MEKHLVFFDDASWEALRPLTLTRPVCELRVGILTLREKWLHYLSATSYSYITRDYLNKRYPAVNSENTVIINGAVLPLPALAGEIMKLEPGSALLAGDTLVALVPGKNGYEAFLNGDTGGYQIVKSVCEPRILKSPCDIFSFNAAEISGDFEILAKGKKSQPLSGTCTANGKHPVFIEEGGRAECAVFNTNDGPVYIGRNAEVMEGCLVRGPFALCEDSTLKMGAKIYGGTTIGPHCKVGGEVNNSVFFGYSNKAHDGFLGNSVIGEWVNIGADSNNSNLKNNYAPVKMWSYSKKRFTDTGLTFAGLIMGDHSKCSINTMFNTGTVVGVSCNLFGAGFHRNFIPSFTWGSPQGYTHFAFEKATEVAEIMMGRRGLELRSEEKEILLHLYSIKAEGI